MRVLDLLTVVLLLGAAGLLIRYLAGSADQRLIQRRLRDAVWRRTEYVDPGGATHVVLRRSARDARGAEILADHDREVAVIPAGEPDFDDRLARARLEADLSVTRTNYRRQ